MSENVLMISGAWRRIVPQRKANKNFFCDKLDRSIKVLFFEESIIHQHINAENRNLLTPIADLLLLVAHTI